jgi:hypothetical protein
VYELRFLGASFATLGNLIRCEHSGRGGGGNGAHKHCIYSVRLA